MQREMLEYRILQHLAKHPTALETVGGIAAEWLNGENPRKVAFALSRLVSTGLVQSVGCGLNALYYANDTGLINTILEEHRSRQKD